MTLAELARLTRKTKGYLSKIERSRKLPPFTTLSMIAQALGVDLDLFLASQAPVTGNDAASLAAPRKGLPYPRASAHTAAEAAAPPRPR